MTYFAVCLLDRTMPSAVETKYRYQGDVYTFVSDKDTADKIATGRSYAENISPQSQLQSFLNLWFDVRHLQFVKLTDLV